MPPVVCPICRHDNCPVTVSKVRESRFDVRACPACQIEFLHPQPTWEEIQKIYSSDYYASWDMKKGENHETARMKRLTFARRLSEIRNHVQEGAVLDIGTATGFFLDEVVKDPKFEAYGVELSPYAGALAQQKFGPERIHVGTVDSAPFPDGFFSVTAMSDLLEHVQDPLTTLRRVHKLLRVGGIALIMTPDATSPSRRAMGARWPHFKLEHLFYFSPRSIGILAKEAGFEVASLYRARKTMTLKYLTDQFQVYRHPLFSPLSRVAHTILRPWVNKPFPVTMGEMVVILRKGTTPHT